MNQQTAFPARLLRNEWREIGSAPFDHEAELAFVNENISVSGGLCLPHSHGWLDELLLTRDHWS